MRGDILLQGWASEDRLEETSSKLYFSAREEDKASRVEEKEEDGDIWSSVKGIADEFDKGGKQVDIRWEAIYAQTS